MVIREILEAADKEIAAAKATILRLSDFKNKILACCQPKADEAGAAEDGPAIAGRIGCHDEANLQPVSRRKKKAA